MADEASEAPKKRTLGVLLFPEFELLDVFGPAEMFGVLKDFVEVVLVAELPGPVASAQGVRALADYGFDECPHLDLLLVPGGFGTRREIGNAPLLGWLRARARDAELVMSVCTGSALLAKAGLLDGRRATTNKRAFDWVAEQGPKVEWVKRARWVEDGTWVTSSGVSAGMDMALAVVKRLFGEDISERVAHGTEYDWHRDSTWDPFAMDYDKNRA